VTGRVLSAIQVSFDGVADYLDAYIQNGGAGTNDGALSFSITAEVIAP